MLFGAIMAAAGFAALPVQQPRRMRNLLLILLAASPAYAVLNGLPLGVDDHALAAVVGVWGRDGTVAEGLRCTGTLISPEVVLTAASCVIRSAPVGLFEHVACAHGGVLDTKTCKCKCPKPWTGTASHDAPANRRAS